MEKLVGAEWQDYGFFGIHSTEERIEEGADEGDYRYAGAHHLPAPAAPGNITEEWRDGVRADQDPRTAHEDGVWPPGDELMEPPIGPLSPISEGSEEAATTSETDGSWHTADSPGSVYPDPLGLAGIALQALRGRERGPHG